MKPKIRLLLILLALVVITLVSFWPVGRLGFINHDDEGPQGYIVDNPNIQSGINFESISWAFTTVRLSNWHPVTWLSHMLDYTLFGLNASGHHWMNLGFHIINALLLFIVLMKMTGAIWRSALVAALFAVNPVHVQSVAWVSERKDLLSGTFMMLTLWAYTRFAQKSEVKNQDSDLQLPTSGFYWLAFMFFALGLMSKPMLVTLPIILLLLDFWPFKRVSNFEFRILNAKDSGQQTIENKSSNLGRLLFEKLPFLGLAMVSCIITVIAQQKGGAVASLAHLPLEYRFENALVSYTSYLGKIFWPANLSIFYPYTLIHSWQIFGSGLLLIGISAFCIRKMPRQPFLSVGWFWFLVMLVPVIGILQVGEQSMADRYTYLPSIGLFIFVAWTMAAIPSFWQTGAKLVAVAVVAIWMVDTRIQLGYWRNSVTLFTHAHEITGDNPVVNLFLGNALWESGNLNEAASNYQYIVRVAPDFEDGHYYLGRILLQQKKYEEAQAQFLVILQSDPSNPFVRKFLGDTLSAQNKLTEAEAEYSYASQLKPGDSVIQEALGKIYFLRMLHDKPDAPDVLNNLAWLLATSQNEQNRDGAQAVVYAERACTLTHYRETVTLGTLAAAYAEAGRFDEAISTAQKACALATESGASDLLNRNQELLKLYRAHQPYHDSPEKLVHSAP